MLSLIIAIAGGLSGFLTTLYNKRKDIVASFSDRANKAKKLTIIFELFLGTFSGVMAALLVYKLKPNGFTISVDPISEAILAGALGMSFILKNSNLL